MMEIKSSSILAKIMSGEDVRLVVNESGNTASFDLKNRIVRIPEKMFGDENFKTMVIGHEIAHCLYTPYDEFINFMNSVKAKQALEPDNKIWGYAMSANNIIEDVRIDRLIQIRYPGLKKHYRLSVNYIYKNDFFEVKGKNINELSFLNRLCIYSKADIRDSVYTYNVKFSAEEQPYVDRCLKAETFQDVCDLTFEILQKFPPDQFKNLDDAASEEEVDKNSSESGGEGKEGKGKDGSGGNLPERMNVDEENLNKNGAGKDEDEKQKISAASDKYGNKKLLIDMWNDKVSEERTPNAAISHSLGKSKSSVKYIKEPTLVSTSAFRTKNGGYRARASETFEKTKINSYVNKFSAKFLLKKRARELTKTFESDTGILDTSKLARYKFDDKIFKSLTVENMQKNHGFIILADCSGSMSDVFATVSKQLYMLQKICTRIGVPHYAFGYTTGNDNRGQTANFDSSLALYEFFNTGMKAKDVDENFNALLSGDIAMGGTPSSEALISMIPYIKKMRQEHRIDILNVIHITDGADGTHMDSNYLSYKGSLIKQGHSPRGVVDNINAIYSILKENFDVRISHLDITNSLPASFLDNKDIYFFKEKGYVTVSDFGGADNVLWITEKLIKEASTTMIDSFTKMLA